MTPPTILNAIRLGETALKKHHAALDLLWIKFGKAIRQERRRQEISVKVMAGELGCTSAFVCMLESGSRRWTWEKAELAVGVVNNPGQTLEGRSPGDCL